jgi:signal transduction histidine kinase
VRLQWQLTIAFAAVALAPIGVIGFGARYMINRQYRHDFELKMRDTELQVEDELKRLSRDVRKSVEDMAHADDPLLHPLLVRLAHGPLDDDEQQQLMDDAERTMRARGLDVLTLLDERGTVLASAHFRGRAGEADPDALERARAGGADAHLFDERVVDRGHARPALAIEATRTVELPGAPHARVAVIVVAGRVLGARFLQPLHETARLISPEGAVLVVREHSLPPPPDSLRRIVALTRGDSSVAAFVEFWESRAELEQRLESLTLGAALAAIIGLVLASLGGALVARRFSRPLGRLADGARAVSRGELDTQVPVRGRDEVGELGAAFNTMTRDLRAAREELVRAERVAAWREIAQRIAHEIKNPLTPIQMAIETLQRAQLKGPGVFDALFAESAETILDEVSRLKHIVAEFSSFARMPQPVLRPCAVGEVVEAALKLYAGAVPVEQELDPALPPALADRDQLTQVLLNLVENAREAVTSQPAGGRIHVRTRSGAGGERVELEVADDGPGIPEEARARLFTPYFTTKARGTGLGLAIVHRIVSDHGGEIRVGGAPGTGAVFTVSLPRA